MVDASLLPVIAGLAVGIGFLVALTVVMGNLPSEDEQSSDAEILIPRRDDVGTPKWVFFESRCYPEEGQVTIAVNSREGTALGMRPAVVIDPAVVESYPMLQNIIRVADREPEVIFCSPITISDAGLLTANEELEFAQTCFELVCYDEVSSFINFGNNTSYVIRIFKGADLFAADNNSSDRTGIGTGIFEPETEVGEPILIEISDENNTSMEVIHEED